VRVVKGQWVDPDWPDIDLREGYLAVIDRLAGRARHVAVATHDPPLALEALKRLQAAGTSCEMELLFGLPMKAAMKVAAEAGVRVRLYIPYGESWLPYAFSQMQKNPRIIWWVIRDTIFGHI
jgi:proline dehydrogenase